jgi:hypothetical protein
MSRPETRQTRWRIRRAFLTLTLTLISASLARAQASLVTRALDSATVVRLHFANDGVVAGRLLSPFGPTSSSLRYCSVPYACGRGQGTVVIPAAVSRLEVQTGTRAGRGFLIGTALLSVVVVPVVYIGGSFTQGETRGSLIAKGLLLSAIVGGGVGALVGHTKPTWSAAP